MRREYRSLEGAVKQSGLRDGQVRTVLLIALLAISRKFIILEAEQYTAPTIVALAAVVSRWGSPTG